MKLLAPALKALSVVLIKLLTNRCPCTFFLQLLQAGTVRKLASIEVSLQTGK